MANKYLARDDAPFESAVWELLDATMQQVARSQLVGRRILDIEGPYGLGLKAVPLADSETESGLIASPVVPVFFVHKPFTLGTRDIASYERDGLALDTGPVVEATLECARLEDDLIFHGAPNVAGLLAAQVRCASIVLGQDMNVGYIGPAGSRQEFSISESLAVRIRQPEAICILE